MSAPEYLQWLGRVEEAEDIVTVDKVRALRATLDYTDLHVTEGDELPPTWHWILANAIAPASALGRDGHPAKGGFLPPVPLPRRMWAGSQLEFRSPIRVGDRFKRRSEIVGIQEKSGSSGPLVFVTVQHKLSSSSGGEVIDTQDLVFREDPKPGATPARAEPPPTGAELVRDVTPDSTMLFRYSALTFNGHRIHYDLDYVTKVEGYEGLVVHGPILATLMVELVRHELERQELGVTVKKFRFAGKRPVTVPTPIQICARREGLVYSTWVVAAGAVASAGQVEVSS
jgi:3-methylfumaryl-CoA hydratase